MDDRTPADARAAIDDWLTVHDEVAPGVVEGLYLVGSAALDDWQPTSDVDIVAFVADPTDGDDVTRLAAAHDRFRSLPGRSLVDGPYLAWADVSTPPLSAQRAWSLDGAFHFDGECFEINPVTWYTLATHGVVIRGPAVADLGVATDAAARQSWVTENVDTYWRAVLEQLAQALESDPGRDEFDPSVQEWCALGIARMAYTFDTGDVTSKTRAGEWLATQRPEHGEVLSAAVRIRNGLGDERVGRTGAMAVAALLTDEIARITEP